MSLMEYPARILCPIVCPALSQLIASQITQLGPMSHGTQWNAALRVSRLGGKVVEILTEMPRKTGFWPQGGCQCFACGVGRAKRGIFMILSQSPGERPNNACNRTKADFR